MKNKPLIFISLILITFMVIISYTPKAAQAEMLMQEDPMTDDPIIYSDIGNLDFLEEVSSEQDNENHINTNLFDFFNAVGSDFMANSYFLDFYTNGTGCLGSNYSGDIPKTWSIPVNVPHGAEGFTIYFTYFVNTESSNHIQVRLYRRYFGNLTKELLKTFYLGLSSTGEHFSYFSINDLTFDTDYWLYYLEFELPQGSNTHEFCGVQIVYFNPPLFPLASPIVDSKK